MYKHIDKKPPLHQHKNAKTKLPLKKHSDFRVLHKHMYPVRSLEVATIIGHKVNVLPVYETPIHTIYTLGFLEKGEMSTIKCKMHFSCTEVS